MTGEYKGLAFRYPRCRNTETSNYNHIILISRFRKSGFRIWRIQGSWPLVFLVAKTLKQQDLSTLDLFGVSYFEISQLANTRELTLGFPGVETLKDKTYPRYTYFGVSQVRISRLANTRKLTLGFPGCQNIETPRLIHARPFWGLILRGFATGEYKGTYPWISQVPKHRKTKTYPRYTYSRVSQVGISHLANTRKLTLGFLGCQNTEI